MVLHAPVLGPSADFWIDGDVGAEEQSVDDGSVIYLYV